MKKSFYRTGLVATLAAIFIFSCITMDPAEAAPKRELWSCYDVGASGYIQTSTIADAMLKKYGIRVRLTPSGTAVGRIMPVINKQVKYGFLANEVLCAVEATYEFSRIEWGPQDLRIVLAHPGSLPLSTTKDSGIKTLADAKGKRWAYWHASTSIIKMEGYLAFAGFTWDDIIPVEFPNYRAHAFALKEGKADVAMFQITSSYAYEMESHPRGLHIIEFPPDDKEALARMQKPAPFFSIGYETAGPGLSKDKGVWAPFYRYPMVTCRTDTNADEVYEFIKKLDETYPLYKDAYPPNSTWALDQSGVPPADAPFHEGAIRYLKEKGVWKAEHDKWNNDRIAHIDRVKALWEEFLDKIDNLPEKEKSKYKGKNFSKKWLEFRKAELAKLEK